MLQNHCKNDFAAIFLFRVQSVFEKSFPQSALPALRYISRIQLRQLNPGSIPLLFTDFAISPV